MKLLEIDAQTSLLHLLEELKNTQEDGLEITSVPGEASILDNQINRSILEKAAKDLNKEVVLPAVPIGSAPEVEVDDDLGFIEGEDIYAKAPIDEAHKMVEKTNLPAKEVTPKKNSKFLQKLIKNKVVLVGLGILGFLVLVVVGFLSIPTAQIEVSVNSESKESQVTATGEVGLDEVDIDNKKVPVQSEEVDKEGSDETTATGKKTVGTAAKGRVTITNREGEDKVFVAGTIITPISSTNITFRLDNDVTVPASEEPIGEDGTVGVNVTAVTTGTAGNLAANTSFKVGGADVVDVFAQNEIAFTGGSSKQITVASATDKETLKKQLLDKLSEEATEELETKTGGSLVIDGSIETKVIKETYEPANLDTETDKLKVTISVKVTTYTLDKNKLTEVLVASVEQSSQGYEIDKEASEVSASLADKTSETELQILGKIKAKLRPEIDRNEIKRKTAGKSIQDVGKYLDSLENINSYKVTTSPGFFKIFNIMPFSVEKIQVNLADT